MSKGGTHTKLTGIKFSSHKVVGTFDRPQVYCPEVTDRVKGIMTSAGMQCSHCKTIL